MLASSCSSLTWYSMSSPLLPQLCILYKSTEEEESCPTCVSGPASCTCSSDYACAISDGNLLDLLPQTMSEMECMMGCVSAPGCLVYTWYDQMATVLTNDCLLFLSCPEVDSECIGCHSGPQYCAGKTTETTEPAETTTQHGTTEPAKTTTQHGTSETPETSTQHGTTVPTTCKGPEIHQNGAFDCFVTDSLLICDLLCYPGYAVKHGSRTSCTNGFWQREPSEMICESSILLVTGGSMERKEVELYSTDGSLTCSLSSLPSPFYNHTIQYVDGDILMVEIHEPAYSNSYYGQT